MTRSGLGTPEQRRALEDQRKQLQVETSSLHTQASQAVDGILLPGAKSVEAKVFCYNMCVVYPYDLSVSLSLSLPPPFILFLVFLL